MVRDALLGVHWETSWIRCHRRSDSTYPPACTMACHISVRIRFQGGLLQLAVNKPNCKF